MEAKLFSIRDRATSIVTCAVLARAETFEEMALLARAGYGVTLERQDQAGLVLLFSNIATPGQWSYDHNTWGDRTYQTAHKYIRENWGQLASGDVVDVELILGEKQHNNERSTR